MDKLTKSQKIKLMGKIVLVTHKFEMIPADTRKFEIVECEPRAGWITGFSFILDGKTETDGDYEDGYYTYFVEAKRHLVIKVRFWTNTQEINIPYDGFIYPTEEKPYSEAAKYKEECKKAYQECPEDYPRNSKGQFI
jgi:hypothetical protein